LLAVRIAAKRMLAAEARRDRTLLERVVQRRLRLEEIAHGEEERRDEFRQQQRTGGGVNVHGSLISARCRRSAARRRPRSPSPVTAAGTLSSPAASTGRSGSAARSLSPSRTGRT